MTGERSGDTNPQWVGASRQVAWTAVYRLLSPLLGDPHLIPGTPVWAQLEDTDPAKWQAILWAAVWWAVGEDARQEAVAEAGAQISAAENWAAVSQQVLRRRQIDDMRKAS